MFAKSDKKPAKFQWKSIIKTNIMILRVVGLWPRGAEGYEPNLYTLYSAVLNFVVSCSSIFQSAYIFLIYTDLQALAAIIFVIFTDWLAAVKVCYFVFKTSILKEQMTELESTMFQPKLAQQRVFQASVTSWRLIYTAFSVLTIITLHLWTFFPILDGTVKEHRLPFWAWYPYDAHSSPLYELTYVHQIISVWCLAMANVNMDALIAALMMFISAQCDVLSDNLKGLTGDDFNDKLVECIKHHKRIVRFAANCNRFFNEIALGQFFTSSASLALAMFQLTLVEPLSSECYSLLFYVSAITVQIFLYCWCGTDVEVRVSHLSIL
ncbi:hypothetical protein MTP99_008872 [Tenebrio molitor]|nr:hypothetical protein MTP99_008872 [Tenebrio molitor]